MKIISIPVVAITLLLAGCVQESSEQPEPGSTTIFADVVYTNGNIYTVNEDKPWAEAVAIKDGKLVVVGPNEESG